MISFQFRYNRHKTADATGTGEEDCECVMHDFYEWKIVIKQFKL